MAIIEVVVPQLSESVAEATLLTWNKKIGEAVKRDENLIDVETDKVVLELPAPASGLLVEIIAADGATVTSGQLIAKIDTEAASASDKEEAKTGVSVGTATPEPAPAVVTEVRPMAGEPISEKAAGIAMPAASKILAENNEAAAKAPCGWLIRSCPCPRNRRWSWLRLSSTPKRICTAAASARTIPQAKSARSAFPKSATAA